MKYPICNFLLSLSLSLFFNLTAISAESSDFKSENPLQGKGNLSAYTLEAGKQVELQVDLFLPDGYRAYDDKFKIEILDPEGFKNQKLEITPLQKFFDQTSKKNKIGMIGKAKLVSILETPSHLTDGEYKLKIAISYQACTKTYCLFPAKLNLEIPFVFKTPISSEKSPENNLEVSKMTFEGALNQGLVWAFVFVFVAGFLTSLTPCVFPMIPITIAVLGRNAHLHSKKKNFLLSNLYVLGIALTYSSLGVFAAATGSMFGSFMSHPVVLSVICFVFFLMALSMFGLFDLQAPEFIRNKFSGDLHLHGYSSAFIYGIIAGVVAGPCVGPVLVGILTYVAKTQNMWLGFWLLFVFAVGMGQLFLILGFSSQMTKLLPRSGSWMNSVKNFFGLLMMGAFFYYLSFLIPLRWWDLVLGAGLIIYGSLFGAFETTSQLHTAWSKIRKGCCQAVIFLGAAFFTIGIFDLRPQLLNKSGLIADSAIVKVQWQAFSEEKLAEAKQKQKPVLIDFGAEWCGACKELDKYTFSHPLFQNAASEFVLLKFDATNESEKLNELKLKYKIVGLPTLIFYDKNGTWREDLTTTEFLEAPILVEKMRKLF